MKIIELCQEIWRCLLVIALFIASGSAFLFWTTAVASFEWVFCRDY